MYFLHKTSLISYGVTICHCSWVQFLTQGGGLRSFSPGAVATIALWKSAPICFRAFMLVRRQRHGGRCCTESEFLLGAAQFPEMNNYPRTYYDKQ